MLKSYEAVYENGHLNWLDVKPKQTKAKVLVIFEDNVVEDSKSQKVSIKSLKGIAPKPNKIISLEEMDEAIQLEGAKL